MQLNELEKNLIWNALYARRAKRLRANNLTNDDNERIKQYTELMKKFDNKKDNKNLPLLINDFLENNPDVSNFWGSDYDDGKINGFIMEFEFKGVKKFVIVGDGK